jgi:hypothetical protein
MLVPGLVVFLIVVRCSSTVRVRGKIMHLGGSPVRSVIHPVSS